MSNIPEVKSGKLMQVDELEEWHGDDVHGNSVRILGRVVKIDIANSSIDVEYHNARIRVCTSLLDGPSSSSGNGEGSVGLRVGVLFQFLGEVERDRNGKVRFLIPHHFSLQSLVLMSSVSMRMD